MTDEEIGKQFFYYTNRNWPNRMEWEDLPKPTQSIWIKRAKFRVAYIKRELEKKNENTDV